MAIERRKDYIELAILKNEIEHIKTNVCEAIEDLQKKQKEDEGEIANLKTKLAVYDNTSSIVKWCASAIVAIIAAILAKITISSSIFGGK